MLFFTYHLGQTIRKIALNGAESLAQGFPASSVLAREGAGCGSVGDVPGAWLEGMMLKRKLQYFGRLMRRVHSLEKTLMLGGIGGKKRRGQHPASRALCQAKRAPRAAFPSGCLAAQTKRWVEGIRVTAPLVGRWT